MTKRKRITTAEDAGGNGAAGQASRRQKSQLESPSCWLMKSEPESRMVQGRDVKFSLDDLAAMKRSPWDGVRNAEARNWMRDQMRIGDWVLFYHSSCKEPGIAGLAQIVREGYPDLTAFDPSHPYYDRSRGHDQYSMDRPRWYMVDVEFVEKFEHFVPLSELKLHRNGALQDMMLWTRGRLSVQPVSKRSFDFIKSLGSTQSPPPGSKGALCSPSITVE